MRLDVITIFPEYLQPLRAALLGRAIERGLVQLEVHDLRSWTHDVHQAVDDSPYGGGPGMVMKADVWGAALDDVLDDGSVLLVPSPAGVPFTQALAAELAQAQHLVFACGRYEGIDERVVVEAAGRVRVIEVSLGDYVLIGGEAAVLVIVEAVVRLRPGVLGNAASAEQDSFSDGLLEGPAYTRPLSWRGHDVPEVLRSGDHARIAAWRRQQSVLRTARRRPELLATAQLSAADRAVLDDAGFVSAPGSGRLGWLPGTDCVTDHA
ncbi:MAG: tRNA (guanosine(37)-N1)-methyltransferase TrmD [Mycobacteriaceae bacterium]